MVIFFEPPSAYWNTRSTPDLVTFASLDAVEVHSLSSFRFNWSMLFVSTTARLSIIPGHESPHHVSSTEPSLLFLKSPKRLYNTMWLTSNSAPRSM